MLIAPCRMQYEVRVLNNNNIQVTTYRIENLELEK